MFDRYMLVENTLRNVSEDGKNFIQVGIRYPHHCGIWVSIIEQIDVRIDRKKIPSENLVLSIHGNQYPVNDLEKEHEDRWNFGEVGLLQIYDQGVLKPGIHEVELKIGLRVSFLEWLLTGSNKKQMELCEA